MLDKKFDHIIKGKVEKSTPQMPPSDWKAMSGLLGHIPSTGPDDSTFDAIIKSKVDIAQPVVPPSNWNALANDLGNFSENNNAFDQQISDKISQAKPAIPASDWSVLASSLGHGTSGASDTSFDKHISDKVSQAKPVIPASNWNALAGALGHGTLGASDASFDQIIKEKVIDATPIIPGATWGLLSDKLGHGTPEAIDAFDAIIKSKVDSANTNIPTPDWSRLSQDLGHNPNEQFDQVIQDKVLSAHITPPPSNWDDLSIKLGHTTKDQVLDTSLKRKLSNASVSFNESHWSILRDQLRRTAQLRKRLYSIKIFESLLAILLFWTFANYSDYIFDPSQKQDKDIIEVFDASPQDIVSHTPSGSNEIAQDGTELRVSKSVSKISYVTEQVGTQNNINETSNTASTENTIDSANNIEVKPSNISANNSGDSGLLSGNNYSFGANISNSTPTISSNALNPFVLNDDENDTDNNQKNTDAVDIKVTDPNASDLNVSGVNNITAGPTFLNFEPISLVNKLIVSKHSAEAPLMSLDYDEIKIKPTKEARLFHGLHLHAIIGYNVNSIDSPQDPVFPIRAYQALSENLNVELRISKTLNFIELGTGLQFQQISYMPKAINETLPDPTRYLSLAKINYSLISMPTFVRLHHKAAKNLTIFADLGLTINAIGWTRYDITEVIENGEEDFPPKPGVFEDEDDIENSRLFMKDFVTGLFESSSEDYESKGQFSNSVYMTLNSGVGVQYLLSDQFGIYSRLNLDQGLGSFKFGPNLDDINSYGLHLGLRYKL